MKIKLIPFLFFLVISFANSNSYGLSSEYTSDEENAYLNNLKKTYKTTENNFFSKYSISRDHEALSIGQAYNYSDYYKRNPQTFSTYKNFPEDHRKYKNAKAKYESELNRLRQKEDNLLSKEENEKKKFKDKMEKAADAVSDTQEKVNEMKNRPTGDTYNIHNNSGTIVIKSTLIDSLNQKSGTDPDLIKALKIISSHITDSKNDDAANLFNEFQTAVVEEKQKSTIKVLWNGLIEELPSINKMTDTVSKIMALF